MACGPVGAASSEASLISACNDRTNTGFQRGRAVRVAFRWCAHIYSVSGVIFNCVTACHGLWRITKARCTKTTTIAWWPLRLLYDQLPWTWRKICGPIGETRIGRPRCDPWVKECILSSRIMECSVNALWWMTGINILLLMCIGVAVEWEDGRTIQWRYRPCRCAGNHTDVAQIKAS